MKKRYLLAGLLTVLLVVALGVFAAACGGVTTTTTAATTVTTAPSTTLATVPSTTSSVAETSTTATTAAALADYYLQRAVWVGPNIPASPDWNYDQALYDAASHRLYLADARNSQVDVWDASNGTFVKGIGGSGVFAGPKGYDTFNFDQGGPNGLALDDQGFLWAADGDGSVKVIDTKAFTILQTIATGAKMKADAFAFDSADGLMAVSCVSDTPFVAFIDAKTYKVVGNVELTGAAATGQVVWNESTGKVYVAVATDTGKKNDAGDPVMKGDVYVIDPAARTVASKIDLGECDPSGEAFGPGTQLLVGTSVGSPAVIDVATGKIITRLDAYAPQLGLGIDFVAFDSVAQRYFLGDPQGIGVIDAATLTGLPNINSGSRVVTVDSATHTIYVPLDGKGVGVFVPGQ